MPRANVRYSLMREVSGGSGKSKTGKKDGVYGLLHELVWSLVK